MSSLVKRAPTENLLALVEPPLKSRQNEKRNCSWSNHIESICNSPKLKKFKLQKISAQKKEQKSKAKPEKGFFVLEMVEELMHEEALRKFKVEDPEEDDDEASSFGKMVLSDFEDLLQTEESIVHREEKKEEKPKAIQRMSLFALSDEFTQIAERIQDIQLSCDEN